MTFIPVILAGGKGERFWPVSRKARPKQFLCLDGSGKSLLQATADRLLALAGGWDGLWVCTSSQLETGVQEQLPQLPGANLLAEPEGRDTAPALAWATLEVAKKHGDDAIIGFFPADHWIGDEPAFRHTINAAAELAAAQDAIVTLGVKPSYPSTGYGYIEQGALTGTFLELPVYKVQCFREKPDVETAQRFLNQGNFSWNSGMFIFRAGVVLAELQKHAPDIINPLQSQGKTVYPQLPKISIDYALMEKTDLAYVLPADFGWDDLGDWNALGRLLQSDKPNVELAQHIGLDSTGCIIYDSSQQEAIVTIGLEDIVVVRDRNVTLIAAKNRTQDIKKALGLLRDHPQFNQLL